MHSVVGRSAALQLPNLMRFNVRQSYQCLADLYFLIMIIWPSLPAVSWSTEAVLYNISVKVVDMYIYIYHSNVWHFISCTCVHKKTCRSLDRNKESFISANYDLASLFKVLYQYFINPLHTFSHTVCYCTSLCDGTQCG